MLAWRIIKWPGWSPLALAGGGKPNRAAPGRTYPENTLSNNWYNASVQRTVRLRLKPTYEQRAVLLETMRVATACFKVVAAYGWTHEQRNSVELHKATYYSLRSEHPMLPAQLVISSRMRAGEAIT